MSNTKVSQFQPVYFLVFLFSKYWMGRGSLVLAFWVIFILGNILFFFVSPLLVTAIGIKGLVIPVLILAFSWVLYSVVAVWRCSKNTSNKVWGDIAKMCIILPLCGLVFGVIRSLL